MECYEEYQGLGDKIISVMPLITVLTPTYNRAHLLSRLYESLCHQTCKDFEWIIVDDGSADNTKDIVERFISTCRSFLIKYYRKDNGGKHTAVNLGIKKAQGELLFIADSDDMLPPDTIDIVAKEWLLVKGNKHIGGIAGLDINMKDGKLIGSGLPREHVDCNAIDIRYVYHVSGDLKEVFRTSVLREFPFPEIPDERFCPEQLNWFRIAQKYDLHYINKPFYLVEYESDGLTAGITKVRMHSPIASMMTYAEMLRYDIPFKVKVKAAINYWRFRYCYRRTEDNKGVNIPKVSAIWSLAAPFGMLFHLKDKRAVGKKNK